MEIFLPMNIRNKLIVQNIRSFAQMRGTSIKQIEKDLGLGNGMIGKWEDSKKSPPFETIEVIANYLGASILELAGITPSENEKAPATEGEGYTDLQKAAIQFVLSLPPEKLERFIKMGRAAFEEDQ
jgi:transcriptional regulator with XRE-family HTH domain